MNSPPKDAEGYVHSFAADDEVGIRNFFQRYGVVVVRGVLTAAEIQRGYLWALVSVSVMTSFIYESKWEFNIAHPLIKLLISPTAWSRVIYL